MNRRTSQLSHRNRKGSPSKGAAASATPPVAESAPVASSEVRYNECQEAVEKLTEYLSHESVEADQNDLQAHLHKCEGCFAKFEFEETLLRTIRERINQIVAPAPLRERILSQLDAEVALAAGTH